MTPLQLAQTQFEAYNARDLAAFIACYSESVQVFRPPSPLPTLVGKAAFAEFYATQRFNCLALKAELVNRMVLGDTVIDHERIHGLGEKPLEMAVVYQVQHDLIQTVHAYPA
ncbi:MAG: nuclear transport factor 2 family protein [Pseudomonadota bacterium]